jgi:hypothetical protein
VEVFLSTALEMKQITAQQQESLRNVCLAPIRAAVQVVRLNCMGLVLLSRSLSPLSRTIMPVIVQTLADKVAPYIFKIKRRLIYKIASFPETMPLSGARSR